MNTQPTSVEQELLTRIFSFKRDPYGFVLYAFPWGEKNTILKDCKGPRKWQIDMLEDIKNNLSLKKPIYVAISSGRGPGKSAFLAFLSLWMMSCYPGATNIVTANTENQLRSKTMAELGKWHGLLINRHWFDKATMSLRPSKWFKTLLEDQLRMNTQYYYTEGQSWSVDNPDAFAGAHSSTAMMVQFDEASGIANPIWAVTEGFFTDLIDLRMWVVISNPRRNEGEFFNCFHTHKKYWLTRHIDSRNVEGIDPTTYQRIADRYGEDSDVTRIEVKGMFPHSSSSQFIPMSYVTGAIARAALLHSSSSSSLHSEHPLLMGVDVARFGEDASVVAFRRGRNAAMPEHPVYHWRGLNLMDLSTHIAHLITAHEPDVVFIDGGGMGAGVVDRLRQLRFSVVEVQSGSKAREPVRWMNKRVEMWGDLKEWLLTGAIFDDPDLVNDLTTPNYFYKESGAVKLESKDSMKKRGCKSTDRVDALALTFAEPTNTRQYHSSNRHSPYYDGRASFADMGYEELHTSVN